MSYHLKGRLLEVCNCQVLCPCWVGEDPDRGTCDSALAHHFDEGQIDGVDVSGLTLALAVHIPGNVLDGNWKAVVFIDDKANEEQTEAIMKVYSGKAGGPIADFVQLFGEVLAVERAPIQFDVEGGKGTLRIGDSVHAELEPFTGPSGEVTQLVDSIFSTIPGSPAYVGKALSYRQKSERLGQDIDLEGHNAIQGKFLFEHAA
ncbi:MAG TPA: DUF1326 domain-containing protein [Acidobacteriota bacterium]|nr:DUF1326 domain-containing protein [Acidobacteriota bacterium]